MSLTRRILFVCLVLILALASAAAADDKKTSAYTNLPIAVIPFRERGEEVKGLGAQASDLVFAKLAKEPTFWLVDREDLAKTLAEQELSLSGAVDPASAVKIGHITAPEFLSPDRYSKPTIRCISWARCWGLKRRVSLGCPPKARPATISTHWQINWPTILPRPLRKMVLNWCQNLWKPRTV